MLQCQINTATCIFCSNRIAICVGNRTCGRCPKCAVISNVQCNYCGGCKCNECKCDRCGSRACYCHIECKAAAGLTRQNATIKRVIENEKGLLSITDTMSAIDIDAPSDGSDTDYYDYACNGYDSY